MERKKDQDTNKDTAILPSDDSSTIIMPTPPVFNHENRLRKRKELLLKRKSIANVMLCFGFVGLALMFMLVELDLYNLDNYRHNERQSQITLMSHIQLVLYVKYSISVSTLILVGLVFVYHCVDMQFYCLNNSINDWRISITKNRIAVILLECFVCGIHPLPVFNSTDDTATDMAFQTHYDVFMALPMFARVFLLLRVMLLNSKLVNDTCSQSIGFLNKVKIDFKFYFKSIMNQQPDGVLALATVLIFLISAWSTRVCENSVINNNKKFDIVNSIWFIAITFLTVG